MAVAILSVIGVAVVALNRVERPTDPATDPLDTPSASTAPELAAPSSLVLDVSTLDPERAYLSIVVDDADLNDPVIGLLANQRGGAARGSAPLSSHISTRGHRGLGHNFRSTPTR